MKLKSPAKPPLIVIGMHRSGTTLVTSLLAEMGIHMGVHLDANSEPPFFENLNNWLMRQCGAEWDNPAPFQHFLARADAVEAAERRLRRLLESPRAVLFLGPMKYLRYRSVAALDRPWGWKDPRNTFTLPVWMRLFPDARVLHVYRHGVDVAASLKVRAEKNLAASREKAGREKGLFWMARRPEALADTCRCLTLEGGFSLWREYAAQARAHAARLGSAALEIRYEDFLASPADHLAAVARFAGVPIEPDRLATLAGRVRQERAFAYRSDPETAAFAKGVAGGLQEFGYDA